MQLVAVITEIGAQGNSENIINDWSDIFSNYKSKTAQNT